MLRQAGSRPSSSSAVCPWLGYYPLWVSVSKSVGGDAVNIELLERMFVKSIGIASHTVSFLRWELLLFLLLLLPPRWALSSCALSLACLCSQSSWFKNKILCALLLRGRIQHILSSVLEQHEWNLGGWGNPGPVGVGDLCDHPPCVPQQ